MTKRLRVAVLGLGPAGRQLHLPSLRRLRRVEVAIACDPDPGARRAVSGIPTSSDPDDALAPDVDAVVVATPPHTHADLARRAVRAGKHVYLEKPMATDLEDALRLLEEVRSSDRVLQMGFAYRHHPLWRRVRRLVQRGRLRPPLHASGRFSSPFPGAGWDAPIVTFSIHHLDLLTWLLGAAPAEIKADRDGTLEAFWEGGTHLRGVYVADAPSDRVELSHGKSEVIVDRFSGTRLVGRGIRLGAAGLPVPGLVRVRVLRSDWERAFEFAMGGFVSSVLRGSPASPSAADGVAAVAMSEAVLRSLAAGGGVPVTVPQMGGPK
ncbi:MAG: Gfo/Idh/MocA family protein [Actinomycetota bacterium]